MHTEPEERSIRLRELQCALRMLRHGRSELIPKKKKSNSIDPEIRFSDRMFQDTGKNWASFDQGAVLVTRTIDERTTRNVERNYVFLKQGVEAERHGKLRETE
jgi:hypothetical protein